MKGSLILLEFSNISTAFYMLDHITQNFSVEVMTSKPLCPGRYLLILNGSLGDVGGVKREVEEIKSNSSKMLGAISLNVIGSIEKEVMNKINLSIEYPKNIRNLAMLELGKSVDTIQAGDIIYKNGDIEILTIKIGIGMGAKGVILYEGSKVDLDNSIQRVIEEYENKIIGWRIINSPTSEFLDGFKL